MMLDGSDLSQAPVPHGRKFEWKIYDFFSHGFLSAANVDIPYSFFWVRIRFLSAVFFRAVGLFWQFLSST